MFQSFTPSPWGFTYDGKLSPGWLGPFLFEAEELRVHRCGPDSERPGFERWELRANSGAVISCARRGTS